MIHKKSTSEVLHTVDRKEQESHSSDEKDKMLQCASKNTQARIQDSSKFRTKHSDCAYHCSDPENRCLIWSPYFSPNKMDGFEHIVRGSEVPSPKGSNAFVTKMYLSGPDVHCSLGPQPDVKCSSPSTRCAKFFSLNPRCAMFFRPTTPDVQCSSGP